MNIFVTGGTGYIGSNTCVKLIEAGHNVIVADNFYNSMPEVLDQIKIITGKTVKFYETDLLDAEGLDKIFEENEIDCVIHFAGYKAVGESCQKPLKYYNNNITGTLNLLFSMRNHNVKKIVFSSSATVYGNPETVPICEDAPLSTTNPYGSTKLFIENILKDISKSDEEFSISILRYFNPIGADKSGYLGDNPVGIPNNLMPYIVKVAKGELSCLNVFGNDYDTHDGTGVRDYVHVSDLADAHIKAVEYIADKKGCFVHNIGTGVGYSVLDIVKTFEKVNNIKIPYKITPRRPGDIATCFANPEKAKKELSFTAKLSLEDMCRDSWNYAKDK
ncbi:MAG: UDP-glucose 4-epimerase GalE [Clostridia bacterium]|nr:UDP-glucose 4-epimerase GalE [Clostridia bacterium]